MFIKINTNIEKIEEKFKNFQKRIIKLQNFKNFKTSMSSFSFLFLSLYVLQQ